MLDFFRVLECKSIGRGGEERFSPDSYLSLPIEFALKRSKKSRALETVSSRSALPSHLKVGMDLQALHFAYAPDERAFLSVAAFYKAKSRLKGWLIPEGKYRKTDAYSCVHPDFGVMCENWS